MNTLSAAQAYLNGDKVRRTIWNKGSSVQLTEYGKTMTLVQQNREHLEENGTTLMSPLEVLDRNSAETNKDKKWELA